MPILLGVIPFGLIYGVLAVSAGLPSGMALAMSSIVFAGSAQFIITQLVAVNTPALVIILTATIVNVRHMLYSASLAPHMQRLSWMWKLVLSYLLTDEAYAVVITRYHREDGGGPSAHWYFLGAGVALWATWQISTAAGVFLGAQVPASWSLDFTLALTFIAIVVPALKDRASVAAAVVAGVVSIAAFSLPLKLGLVAAILIGIAAGLIVEKSNG